MIICSVGKCPADGKTLLCCLYCLKRKGCPNACKSQNMSCNLSRETVDKKKELRQQLK
ncbi:hypothetical protein RBU49_06740 [Clostridium sp. MB40-C1]|uniref:hypothetical protein n=1 Tax=Clostridium sp. MB40-C1 TaxID=3070996 RepID=UPI0027E20B57|nr:hypothetical protein [Clostridium sp. MB40-C1]WMJ81939.1 hypothetical protein RBU49_06740 [Clostridium sp. MB40-C1]